MTLAYESKPFPSRQLMGGLLVHLIRYYAPMLESKIPLPWRLLAPLVLTKIERMIYQRGEWVSVDVPYLADEVFFDAAFVISDEDLCERVVKQFPRLLRLPARAAVKRVQRLFVDQLMEMKANKFTNPQPA